MTRSSHALRAAVCCLVFGAVGFGVAAQEVKVSKVNLRVKENEKWIQTTGKLFKVVGNNRSHAADIDAAGKLDIEVKCTKNDRFEADADSYFDQPTPPPRLTCREVFEFQFVRAVHADWVKTSGKQGVASAAAPFVFSELTTRSSAIGKYSASSAFNDAAIASTAQLLGDSKLDKFVSRDPNQNFKLVFNEAGVEALKSKQREAGVATSGQLDSATQTLFMKELAAAGGTATPPVAPAVTCGSRTGQLFCSTSGAGTLREANVNPVLNLPAVDFRNR